jgi:glycosyltransferase involved in cell wall biosynthesis
MRAAFFHDHWFGRDREGTYFSNGALPYRALTRYLRHFDSLVVVGRVRPATAATRTVASGAGVEMACLSPPSPLGLYTPGVVTRHVREVVAGVDCVIARLPSLVGLAACAEASRAAKPWMVEVVGDALGALWNHGSVAGKLLAAPIWLRTRRWVARAPFALYVSQEFLQRRYPTRGESVGCSNAAVEGPRADVLERRLGSIAAHAGAPPTLGLVGSLDVDYKGHETALRALALLRRGGLPGARLRLLGGGDPRRWRARAAALGVADAIELGGTLPGGAPVLAWMDALDVLLVPSETEGVPRALVEAMSRALPAVGARVGGIPELIDPEWTHAPGDARALAAIVARLAGDPDRLRTVTRRNWEAAAPFAADVLEERRATFLARFAASARAPAPRDAPRPALVEG